MFCIKNLYIALISIFCIHSCTYAVSGNDNTSETDQTEHRFFSFSFKTIFKKSKAVSWKLFKKSAIVCTQLFWWSLCDLWKNYGPAPVSHFKRKINDGLVKFQYDLEQNKLKITQESEEHDQLTAHVTQQTEDHKVALTLLGKRYTEFVKKFNLDIEQLPIAMRNIYQPKIDVLEEQAINIGIHTEQCRQEVAAIQADGKYYQHIIPFNMQRINTQLEVLETNQTELNKRQEFLDKRVTYLENVQYRAQTLKQLLNQ